MLRLAVGLEGVDLQPAVVDRITGGPDDRGDAGLGQVQLQDRVTDAVWVRQHDPCFRLWRQVQAIGGDIRVGGVQQGQVVFVAAGNVFRQVRFEAHHAVVDRLGQANQGHALLGQAAEVHGMTATRTTDGNGHVLFAGLYALGVPQTQYTQPPAEVAVAIGTWWTIVGADREVDLLAGTLQLIGNLYT
ncbi:hypothetical protein D9M71_557620 [compost metagenome]